MHVGQRCFPTAMLLLAACSAAPPAAEKSVPGTYFPEYLRITAVAPGYTGRPATDKRWLIFLDGYIDNGATARLERMLNSEGVRTAVVYFDSPGGHVVEAMALGRTLRKRGYTTSVAVRAADSALPRPGRCYSACPIAYAGGVQRRTEPGSVLGTHRAANSVPVPDEAAFQELVTGQVERYLTEMGISPELVAMMSRVPHQSIRELTPEELVRVGLVNSTGP